MRVEFRPIDYLNPGFGYQLTILNDRGYQLLWTTVNPATGNPLLTPWECVEVIQMYLE